MVVAGLQAAQTGERAAAVGLQAAEVALALVNAEPTEAQIALSESAVALAEAALAITQAEAAVTQSEAGIAQAEAAVDSAADALARMTLTAPFDGIVADIQAELGEVVTSGVPVVTFGYFGGWLVKTTDLTELDVVDLKVGDPVEIQVDAIPGELLIGTVTHIAETSFVTHGDVTYEVRIALDDHGDLPLRWGMMVFVDVDVDQG